MPIEFGQVNQIFPKHRCIHHLFEIQADRTPENVALVFGDEQLTYRDLNASANRLAHHLKKIGVGPEDIIGLCLERSLEMVAGILGILKAGAGYLPVDLAYPKERLAFMFEDAQVRVVITQQELLDHLPEVQAEILCLDRDRSAIEAESGENPDSGATPENLAYVIYTSGSTGKPKGVLVTHYNVVRLFQATQSWFNFAQHDVWTLFHSYAFDFSVWEIWGALLYGGKLVVIPYLVSRSPEAFYETLVRERVTVLNQTPSAFRQLIRMEEGLTETRDLHLRLVIFGGEALELQSLKSWFNRHGDRKPQLVNMYGITETTVHVSYRPLTEKDLAEGLGSVIGIPIPDLQMHVLDENLNLVPDEVPGEIFVGGGGVARGYLNREDLTAERFISNPFSQDPAARLYRTGDLAKIMANREVVYLGRRDNQVKLRGFRVELGEIESGVCKHPNIHEAVVICREYQSDFQSLTAYVVPKNLDSFSIGELKRYLQTKLPDYMIPSAFVTLEALPLTVNGKVDRTALPEPHFIRSEMGSAYVAPSNKIERTIAAIYQEILGLDEVGIYDNFFELGGNSLLVGRVVTELRKAIDADLEMVRLFEFPTVNALAKFLSGAAPEKPLIDRVVERAKSRKEAFARRRQFHGEKAK